MTHYPSYPHYPDSPDSPDMTSPSMEFINILISEGKRIMMDNRPRAPPVGTFQVSPGKKNSPKSPQYETTDIPTPDSMLGDPPYTPVIAQYLHEELFDDTEVEVIDFSSEDWMSDLVVCGGPSTEAEMESPLDPQVRCQSEFYFEKMKSPVEPSPGTPEWLDGLDVDDLTAQEWEQIAQSFNELERDMNYIHLAY